MDDTRDDEKRALMLKLYDVEAPMTRLEALEDVASRPTTPEELSLLRAVAEAARGIRLGYVRMGTGDELAVIHGGDRMESALRALDAYHPPVEPLPRECCYCHDPITHGEVCSGCRTPLSPAAQAERRPRPPGELVEALQDRVHEIIEKNCPECQGYGQVNLIEIGRPHWVQCAVCRGTGRVPVSRPAQARKARDGE